MSEDVTQLARGLSLCTGILALGVMACLMVVSIMGDWNRKKKAQFLKDYFKELGVDLKDIQKVAKTSGPAGRMGKRGRKR